MPSLPPPLPTRRPVPPPLPIPTAKPVIGSNKPLPAKAGNPLDGQPQVRYGRVTNPHLLVAVGQWVSVQSTWLWAIRFVPYAQEADQPELMEHEQMGDLYIEFCSGFIGKWEKMSYGIYRQMLAAPSKGRFHYNAPWKSNYVEVRPEIYTGAALEARIRQNG